jgi:hypothetical protein
MKLQIVEVVLVVEQVRFVLKVVMMTVKQVSVDM